MESQFMIMHDYQHSFTKIRFEFCPGHGLRVELESLDFKWSHQWTWRDHQVAYPKCNLLVSVNRQWVDHGALWLRWCHYNQSSDSALTTYILFPRAKWLPTNSRTSQKHFRVFSTGTSSGESRTWLIMLRFTLVKVREIPEELLTLITTKIGVT